jgi:hypothetical protein
MSHTPGPWSENINDQTANDYHTIAGGIGYHMEGKDPGIWLAGCMSQADARLIAAAPDLLEALEELVRDGYSEENEQRALSAIAKAKGE